jgi:hypothetical protein
MHFRVSSKIDARPTPRLTAWLAVAVFAIATAVLSFPGSSPNIASAQASTLDQPKGQKQSAPNIAECAPDWAVVPVPNYSQHNYLTSIGVVSANDIWAVGQYHNGSIYQTLSLHWDGDTWSVVPIPNMSTGSNLLNGLAAISEDDVWAVGSYNNGAIDQTLIEHWDGTAWNIVPSPNVDITSNSLKGISGVSANDIWTVGSYIFANTVNNTVIEHWDGATWSVIPSPGPVADMIGQYLNGIAAVAGNDVWAAGYTATASETQTLIEHWDGNIWSVVPSPSPGFQDALNGIAAVSSNDIWAVGTYDDGEYGGTLTEHWDGNNWSVFPSPNTYMIGNTLNGLTAISSNDVWAVGRHLFVGGFTSLIEHWDGSAWSIVFSPYVYQSSALYGVAGVSGGDVWAVGMNLTNGPDYALVERYNPCALSCPVQFQDIPPDHTFYPYARCLSCHDIISGYPCGGPAEPCVPPNNYPYFRPNNRVTRGEIAKIVALSAQFPNSINGQTFEDVPPGSTFFTYTEQLAEQGVMNGYPCGNPEPCVPPLNRPYFRPNDKASRGQLAKIDANAAGLDEYSVGQYFQDVPLGSPFYIYIGRLAMLNNVQGYPCGGPGEPCEPPHYQPYFRPGNDVTRGQTTKIVGDTFYPYCYTP